MRSIQTKFDIARHEADVKPNKKIGLITAFCVLIMMAVCVVNELGVFELDRLPVRLSFAVTCICLVIIQLIIHSEKRVRNYKTKFFILGIWMVLTLVLNILITTPAVLTYIFPMLIATQYRSKKMTYSAILGSIVICLLAPAIAYFLNTWSPTYLIGYVETTCNITLFAENVAKYSPAEAISAITLFWSLPNSAILLICGVIVSSISRHNLEHVKRGVWLEEMGDELRKKYSQELFLRDRIVQSMAEILESRDLETGGHIARTKEIVALLTENMPADGFEGLSEADRVEILRCTPLHDIGNIAVNDAILHKPNRLTAEEFEEMKKHTTEGARIVVQVLGEVELPNTVKTASDIVMYHHERYDGAGYPKGLKGKEIPLSARVVALADVYDALVSKRCYKDIYSGNAAYEIIRDSMGTQFDPDLMKYFNLKRGEIEAMYAKTALET